jgi:CubicO group peptidase (beta-lactamase class C family)
LASFLRRAIGRGLMPSAVFALRRRGELCATGAIGQAALVAEPAPAAIDTVYDLASLTKPLCTALLCALGLERRAWGLETRAASVLPELARSVAGRATIGQLLTHTAGLPDWLPLYAGSATKAGYIESIARIQPTRSAERIVYSDLGFMVLGWVIEALGGCGLDRLFAQEIADPLGLRSTRFRPPGSWRRRCAPTEVGCLFERGRLVALGLRAHGFPRAAPRGCVHDRNAHGLGGIAGHAGLFSTAAETALLAEQYLPRRSLLLDPDTCRLFLEPRVRHRGRARALAGQLAACRDAAQSPPLAATAVGHSGFTGTSVWIEPTMEAVYVLLTNRHHPRHQSRSFQPLRAAFHARARRLLRR